MFSKLNNHTIKLLLFFMTIFALQTVLLLVLLMRPQMTSAAIGVRVEPPEGTKDEDIVKMCPCSDKNPNISETVRLFIPIPGVTDSCGYVCDINGDQKGDVVDYVVAIYKFMVGLAAIVAVLMIMIGGYQWIFSFGNASRVSGAKDRIVSAIIGLVLALISVQLLRLINPRLTEVVLPEVEEIGRITIGDYFCGDYDIIVTGKRGQGFSSTSEEDLKAGIIRSDLAFGSTMMCQPKTYFRVARIRMVQNTNPKTKGTYPKVISPPIECFFDFCNEGKNTEPDPTRDSGSIPTGTCGVLTKAAGNRLRILNFLARNGMIGESRCVGKKVLVKIGEQEVDSIEIFKNTELENTVTSCFGRNCDKPSDVCILRSDYEVENMVKCWDPAQYCKDQASSCQDFNTYLHDKSIFGSRFTNKYCVETSGKFFGGCYFGEPLVCSYGERHVNCSASDKCSSQSACRDIGSGIPIEKIHKLCCLNDYKDGSYEIRTESPPVFAFEKSTWNWYKAVLCQGAGFCSVKRTQTGGPYDLKYSGDCSAEQLVKVECGKDEKKSICKMRIQGMNCAAGADRCTTERLCEPTIREGFPNEMHGYKKCVVGDFIFTKGPSRVKKFYAIVQNDKRKTTPWEQCVEQAELAARFISSSIKPADTFCVLAWVPPYFACDETEDYNDEGTIYQKDGDKYLPIGSKAEEEAE